MPAQAAITPNSPGSTLDAAMAVIGTPVPSEMIPSTNRCDSRAPAVGPILLGDLITVTQLGRPVGDQLLDPVGQAGGDRVVVLRTQLGAGGHGGADLGGGLDVRAARRLPRLLRVRLRVDAG